VWLQVRHLPANQVTASVRVGLRPRDTRPGVRVSFGAVTVDAWGLLALQLAQHAHQGSCIRVKGMLWEDTWTEKATGRRRGIVRVGGWVDQLLQKHLPVVVVVPAAV
jgi:single-stranded DNA-binding protein